MTTQIQFKDATEEKAAETKEEEKKAPPAKPAADPAKAKAAAAKAKAAAAKTKAKKEEAEEEDGEEEGEDEPDHTLEASAEYAKEVTSKAPKTKAGAEAEIENLKASTSKASTEIVKQGLSWLRLTAPLSADDESAKEYLKAGVCARKTKEGVKVYNALGLAGYMTQEEAAEAMGLAIRSPRTGKVLMRKLSTAKLAARAHLTLMAGGIKSGLNNEKLTVEVRQALLASGVKNVEDHVGMLDDLVKGNVTSEELVKSLISTAKKNSKRGVTSIAKTKTPDLVAKAIQKVSATVKYVKGKVSERVGDTANWVNSALERPDVDEEQTKALEEARKNLQTEIASILEQAGISVSIE